jgi:hypothetical protein
MSAFLDLVVIDQLVIRALRPAPRGLIVLAGKHAHGSRDGDVSGVVNAELVFPIEASRGSRRVRQPVERDVVKDVVSCEAVCGVSINRAAEMIAAAGWP